MSGVLFLLLASCASGQEISATILGTVTDPAGAVILGATITVVNTDQGIVARHLPTSRSGEYVVRHCFPPSFAHGKVSVDRHAIYLELNAHQNVYEENRFLFPPVLRREAALSEAAHRARRVVI